MRDGKIRRKDFDLHYRVVGNHGPYVILLSGGPGGEVDHLEPVADALSADCRPVLLEQRGTGRSTLAKYDIEALREDLGVAQAILLGNSWGMALALAYGVAHPDRTRAIITLGSGPMTADAARAMQDNMTARLSTKERRQLAEEMARFPSDPQSAFAGMMNIQFPTLFFDRDVANDALTRGIAGKVNLKVMALSDVLLDAVVRDVAPKLGKITAPVLLIQGRQDPAPESNITEVAAAIPNAKLHLMHQCGHEPWQEQPEETWTIVKAFLTSL